MEAQKGRQLAQRPYSKARKLDPVTPPFPFPRESRAGKFMLLVDFKCQAADPNVPSQLRLHPCLLRTAAWVPPTSHLGTISYLAFGTSPGDEKDVARLRPEGSSLGKESSQKSGSQALNCHPPYGLPTRDCLLGPKAAEGGAVHAPQELGPPFPFHLLLPWIASTFHRHSHMYTPAPRAFLPCDFD